MLWFTIAWRNLWRNKRRTAIQLAVIAGSMFLAIFYNNFAGGIYQGMVAQGVKAGSGDIGIYQENYLGDRKLSDTFPVEALIAKLSADPAVRTVHPRVQVPGLLRSSHGSHPAAAMGLDFQGEMGDNPLLNPKYLVSGAMPVGPDGVLIGEILAQNLKVKVGKKVVWMSQDAHGEIASRLFKVSGVMRTHVAAVDSGVVWASRRSMADLIGRPGSAHELAVMLKHPSDSDKALPEIQAAASSLGHAHAYPWQVAMPDLAALIEIGNSKQKSMVFMLFAVVGIGTLNTMLMSVTERTREFGMMRAIGIGRKSIRQMIMLEAVMLSLVGSVIGLAGAVALGLYTSTTGVDLSKIYKNLDMGGVSVDMVIRTAWDWPMTTAIIVGMIILCLVASLYPARWALKIRPADAMRTY